MFIKFDIIVYWIAYSRIRSVLLDILTAPKKLPPSSCLHVWGHDSDGSIDGP